MHLIKTDFNGNPNVGLYAYCNDSYCLVGRDVPENKIKEIKEALKVPVHKINICGISLVGAFCAGNSSCLLVPDIVFETELKELDRLKINYKVIKTKLTALGNNILANDEGCLVNPEFSAVIKKQIRQALNVSLKPGTIAGLNTVGSLGALNTKGCIVHRDIDTKEIEYMQELLKVKCEPCTVNMGNPYVKSGIITNSNGFIVGSASGGPEITYIDEILGFI